MSRILVIEDSSFQRGLIRRMLKVDGHEIVEAADGESGLGKIVEQTPDCILLDLTMPKMSGIEVLERMKEKEIGVPVIVLTADIQDSTTKHCLALGARTVLYKPAIEEKLRITVNSILHPKTSRSDELTAEQVDALGEIINIGLGKAASVLNAMIQSHVLLNVPSVKILTQEELKAELDEHMKSGGGHSTVQIHFKGPFSGSAALVFSTESAAKLVDVLSGDEVGTPDLDAIRIGTLSEVGNIVLNGVLGSMSNVLQNSINYSLPDYLEGSLYKLLTPTEPDQEVTVLLAETHFTVKNFLIEGDIILIFEVGSFDALLASLEALKVELRGA